MKKPRCDYRDTNHPNEQCILPDGHHGRHQNGTGLAMTQPPHLMDVTPPRALDAIADIVLAYRPPSRSKPALRRKRRSNRLKREKAKD
jgi:hypothetical protein